MADRYGVVEEEGPPSMRTPVVNLPKHQPSSTRHTVVASSPVTFEIARSDPMSPKVKTTLGELDPERENMSTADLLKSITGMHDDLTARYMRGMPKTGYSRFV